MNPPSRVSSPRRCRRSGAHLLESSSSTGQMATASNIIPWNMSLVAIRTTLNGLFKGTYCASPRQMDAYA